MSVRAEFWNRRKSILTVVILDKPVRVVRPLVCLMIKWSTSVIKFKEVNLGEAEVLFKNYLNETKSYLKKINEIN